MRFAYLGSGSKGNAALIHAGNTLLMLDCGFTVKDTLYRLARSNVNPGDVTAIVVTHEHSDHVSGVGVVARKLGIPVWMTAGTARGAAKRLGELPTQNLFDPHSAFSIGDIEIEPFPVPHDAMEPAQFVFSSGDRRLGILTDVGSTTSHIEKILSNCDALALECNHDLKMLQRGPYPQSLKDRVAGRLGHLSNDAAAELLGRIDQSRLQQVVAVHMSETNNSPSLAQAALASAMGYGSDRIIVADQEEGLEWCNIEA
jgi:phosphoribosyl 1,2-cyclic phosphodiesterase